MVIWVRHAWTAFIAGMLMYAGGLGLFWVSSQSGMGTDKTFSLLPLGNLIELAAFIVSYAVLGWFAGFSLRSNNKPMAIVIGSVFIIFPILALLKVVPFPFMEDIMFAPIFMLLGLANILALFMSKK